MDGQTVLRWLEQGVGAVLILAALADVFLTVLYARTRIGWISDRVARVTWWLFDRIGAQLGSRRAHFLSYLGPAVMLLIVVAWIAVLTLGAAMIVHPALGTGVKALHTPTPTDFVTAILVGGHSMTIVGDNNFSPETSAFRLFFTFTSAAGLIVTTLALTYILHVYTALQERDALGLKLHLQTDESGDAAELLAGLGAHGHLQDSFTELAEVAAELVVTQEAYHHYPVLFFYRFEEPYYSVSSICLVVLDAVTLIKCALEDGEYAWLKESAATAQARRAAVRLVETLMDSFLDGPPEPPAAIDPAQEERWRARYFAALRRLSQAEVKIIADTEEGAETYVRLRAEWDYQVAYLAPHLGYTMAEIDPEGSDPARSDRRAPFEDRMRSGELR